jgi:hypothetical protein
MQNCFPTLALELGNKERLVVDLLLREVLDCCAILALALGNRAASNRADSLFMGADSAAELGIGLRLGIGIAFLFFLQVLYALDHHLSAETKILPGLLRNLD